MFKINIITIGKNKEDWVDNAVNHYLRLLKKFAQISFDHIPDIKKARSLSEKEIKKAEASLISQKMKSAYNIALSDKGTLYDSITFARRLEYISRQSAGSCDIIIGGVYGLDKIIIDSCREIISLSPLTMSHQLVRPVLLEQLYRGFTIISGGKYHK